MTRFFTLLFIALLPLCLSSCLDSECNDDTEAYVKASFYSYETKQTLVPDSITLYGVGNDVKIYDNQRITPPAFIPLKDSADETQFVIEINGAVDTITFIYTSFPHIISKECGYSMFRTIDSIYFTNNEIDSIALINPNVTLINVENVSIFY